jgi:protein gp37
MAEHSTIEWTDATWNPVRGCSKISPGCKHCYAQTFAERFRGVLGHPYEQGFDLRLVPEKMNEPLKWKASKKIFVNSMSDLFHPKVPDNFIIDVARVMMKGNWHQYQVLTKRSDRLRSLLNTKLRFATGSSHIWWGVSVEDRKHGLPRIDHLRDTPAMIKFLSVEPLLESLGEVSLLGIDWVIVGGESGWGARRLEEEWVQELLVKCQRHDVRFFFKQWGGTRKKLNGRLLNGRTYDELPILQ